MEVIRTKEEWIIECERLIYERDYTYGLVDNVRQHWYWWEEHYKNGHTPEQAVQAFDDNLTNQP